jgi:hypothetical protein
MAERPIQFNLLRKDELIYEAAVRLAVPSDTVAELRAQVKKLNLEIPTDEVAEFQGDIKLELETISSKLTKLKEELQELAGSRSSLKSLNRVQAVAHHLYHRLTRLSLPESEYKTYSELFTSLTNLLARLDNILYNFKSSLSLESSPVQGTLTLQTPAVKPAAVQKLNLTYDGKTCIKQFLNRLEALRISRDIPETSLTRSACELFTGTALSWYEGIKDEVHSWADLKSLLLRDYLPIDFNERLLNEIRSRTQGVEESIIEFISVMQCYFARLDKPISSDEQLSTVMHNIRPFYSKQLALQDITTLAELKYRCRQLEAASQRAKLFTEPSTDNSKSLANDLCYKGTPVKLTSKAAPVEVATKFCVQCRVQGHTLKECRAPKKLICYRCGEKNVTAATCTNCNRMSSTKN